MKYIVPGILLLILAYPLCKFAKKAGHHPLVGLMFFVPGLNIVMLYVFASIKWPIEYERDALVEENNRLKSGMGASEEHTTTESTISSETPPNGDS